MKSITTYINEALKLGKPRYKYHPKTKEELKNLIKQRIKDEGNEVDLNDIDVSNITDMSSLFEEIDFNGDISNWDVSNVRYMKYMFYECNSFNQDISKWNVSNVTNMVGMFGHCYKFNKDISNWNVSKVNAHTLMFYYCDIEEKYKPKFK